MNGILYIIKELQTNYYKVGITKHTPKKRLRDLQTGNPRLLKVVAWFNVDDMRKVESFLHQVLGAYHVRNEWFNLPEYEVKNLIEYLEKNTRV